MSDQNTTELFEYLFAFRLSLQDTNMDENYIIRNFKIYLISKGYPPANINNIIFNFYQYYDINVSIESIQQVSMFSSQNFENLLSNIMNDINNLENIIQNNNHENNENDENDDDENNENDDHENDENNDENNNDDEDESKEDNIIDHVEIFYMNNNSQILQQFNVNNVPITTNISQTLNQLLQNLIQPTTTQNTNPFNDVVVTVDENDLNNLESTKLENNLESSCSVCMSTLQKDDMITTLKCSHIFHTECIKTYLKQYSYKCPVCRCEVGKAKYNI